MRLNCRDHPGYDIVALEQPLCFRLEAGPGARGKFAQQLAIETGMQSKALGNGQHDLPMCDRKTDFFGNVDRRQQRPLLMAGRARATLLAGEGDKDLGGVSLGSGFRWGTR
jgi:hypothetical protein